MNPALQRCRDHARLSDTELAAELLARHPVHQGRDRHDLDRWAHSAALFGRDELPEPVEGAPAAVEEKASGGVSASTVVLAEYWDRTRRIVLYRDALARADRLVELLDWGSWYPPGSLYRAAVTHELAHGALHGEPRRALKRRTGRVLAVGRFRMHLNVAGADEIAAHSYAQVHAGLHRTPILLTLALAETLALDLDRALSARKV